MGRSAPAPQGQAVHHRRPLTLPGPAFQLPLGCMKAARQPLALPLQMMPTMNNRNPFSLVLCVSVLAPAGTSGATPATPPPPREQLPGEAVRPARPFRPAPVPPPRYGRGTRPGPPAWRPPRHPPLVLTLEGMAITKAVTVAVTARRGAPPRGTWTARLPVQPLPQVRLEGTGQEQGEEQEAEGGLAACSSALRAAAAAAVEQQAMRAGGLRARPTRRGKLGGSWSFASRSCRRLRTRRVTWPTLRLSSRRWRSGSRSSSRYGPPSGGSQELVGYKQCWRFEGRCLMPRQRVWV